MVLKTVFWNNGCVNIKAHHPRAALPSELIANAIEMGVDKGLLSVGSAPLIETDTSVNGESADGGGGGGDKSGDGSVTDGINSALRLAVDTNEVVVVCGSVFMMAEARESLGIKEPRVYITHQTHT